MRTLHIITRHLTTRPKLYAAHIAALDAQSVDDFIVTTIRDNRGRGVAWAQTQMKYVHAVGEWVWVLDDDDLAALDAVQNIITAIETNRSYDALLFQFDHNGAILPSFFDDGLPREGYVGVPSLVVKRDVWMQSRQDFGARYAGDWDWISAVLAFWRWKFIPVCIGRVGRVSKGEGDI
jgi:hypothetical protein